MHEVNNRSYDPTTNPDIGIVCTDTLDFSAQNLTFDYIAYYPLNFMASSMNVTINNITYNPRTPNSLLIISAVDQTLQMNVLLSINNSQILASHLRDPEMIFPLIWIQDQASLQFMINGLQTKQFPLLEAKELVDSTFSLYNANFSSAYSMTNIKDQLAGIYIEGSGLLNITIINVTLDHSLVPNSDFIYLSTNYLILIVENLTTIESQLENVFSIVIHNLGAILIDQLISVNCNYNLLEIDSPLYPKVWSNVTISNMLIFQSNGTLVNANIPINLIFILVTMNRFYSDANTGVITLQNGGVLISMDVLISAMYTNGFLYVVNGFVDLLVWNAFQIVQLGYNPLIVAQYCSNFTIKKSLFIEIQSIQSLGSVGYINHSPLKIDNSSILKLNSALAGGALFLNHTDFQLTKGIYDNAASMYGSNLAGSPTQFLANMTNFTMSFGVLQNLYQYTFDFPNNLFKGYQVINTAESVINNTGFFFYFLDAFDQRVFFQDAPEISGSVNGTQISPQYFSCNGSAGNCLISSEHLGLLNSSSQMSNVTINATLYGSSFALWIAFIWRECLPGEYLDNSTNLCTVCPPGFYSANFSDCNQCETSSQVATCMGGNAMNVTAGYWREPNTQNIYPCQNNQRCTGGINPQAQCALNYSGGLCQSCNYTGNYASGADNTCVLCKTNGMLMLLETIGFYLVAYLYELYVIYITNQSNVMFIRLLSNTLPEKEKKEAKQEYFTGILIRLLTNFVQFASIMFSCIKYYDITFLGAITGIETYLNFISNPSTQLSDSLPCLFMSFGLAPSDVTYGRVVVAIVVPVIKIVLTLIIVKILARNNKVRYPKNVFVLSITMLITMEQPGLLMFLTFFTSCILTDVNGGFSILDTNLKCSDSGYLNFRNWIVIPTMILWGILIPLVLAGILLANRKNIDTEHVRRKYGNIINSYKKNVFYWGLVTMIFKIALLVVLGQFLASPSYSIVGLTLMYIYYSLFTYLQPYTDRKFINIEKYSIICYAGAMLILSYSVTLNISGWVGVAFIIAIMVWIGIVFCFIFWKIVRTYLNVRNGRKQTEAERSLLEQTTGRNTLDLKTSFISSKESDETFSDDKERMNEVL